MLREVVNVVERNRTREIFVCLLAEVEIMVILISFPGLFTKTKQNKTRSMF